MKVKQNGKEGIVFYSYLQLDIVVCKIIINPGMAKNREK
jgi:hypothetical protein